MSDADWLMIDDGVWWMKCVIEKRCWVVGAYDNSLTTDYYNYMPGVDNVWWLIIIHDECERRRLMVMNDGAGWIWTARVDRLLMLDNWIWQLTRIHWRWWVKRSKNELPTLSACLWWLAMTGDCDDWFWWLIMMTLDDCWNISTVVECWWWLLISNFVLDYWWLLLVACGWWCLTIDIDWWLMMISDWWWFMETADDRWSCAMAN